jgi:putative flippase GtrA
MKEWMKELGKTAIVMQLPLYGVIIWLFMEVGVSYWYSWFIANCIYTAIIYPVNRWIVFRRRIKHGMEM